MRYDYRCNDCSTDSDWLLFEMEHSMNKRPTIKCPQCGGTNTEQAYLSVPMTYVRGYGWLDVRGRRRDMNLFKLQNDDPYRGMREPGEKDDLAHRLRKGGKFNTNPKRFLMGKRK
jgi:putative FmdB family regulatory protein